MLKISTGVCRKIFDLSNDAEILAGDNVQANISLKSNPPSLKSPLF